MLSKIVLTMVVLIGSIVLFKRADSRAPTYMMVDELIASGLDRWDDQELRVHGWVVAGSIVESVVDRTRRTFVLQVRGKQIRVFGGGFKPDMFRDQSEVVVRGQLVPAAEHAEDALAARSDAEQEWVIEATELMTKCGRSEPPRRLDTRFE